MFTLTRIRALGLFALMLLVFVFVHPLRAQEGTWRWYELDANRKVKLNLYVFWSARCNHCTLAGEFLPGLQQRHPWLNIYYYEITRYPENAAFYKKMADSLNRQGGTVPAFFFCKQLEIGYDSHEVNGARLERNLIRCYEALRKQLERPGESSALPVRPAVFLPWTVLFAVQPAAEPDDFPIEFPAEDPTVAVPLWGEVDASSVSLPALTIVLAGCDAFNPCAFFVLLFLLSLMIHGRSRWRMLVVGGVFVFFSALVYFLFMAAWLNLFFVVGHLQVITLIAGLLAVIAAVLNIKDFVWFHQGPSLSIPEDVKPGLFQRMTRLIRQTSFVGLLAGTVVLAALVNLYELLCTSGFPMVYTRVLTLRDLPLGTYYLYLVLYNLVYVLPLGAIVLAFALTLGSRKLTEYEGRVLKLLSGVMMLMLGILLLVYPQALGTVTGAVGTLAAAIVVTAIVVLIERWVHTQPHTTPPGSVSGSIT